MSLFAKLFGKQIRRDGNPVTMTERARFARTMPGETGARAGERYGFLIN